MMCAIISDPFRCENCNMKYENHHFYNSFTRGPTRQCDCVCYNECKQLTPYNKMFATVVERNDGASTSHGYSSHLYWLSWVPIPLGWGWKKKCYTIQVIKPWRMCSNEQILSLPCGAHLDGCLSMRRGYMERSPYWQTENQEISTTSLS